MKKNRFIIIISLAAFLVVGASFSVMASPDPGVSKDTRCAVCGMFVAKYPTWICRIKEKNGKVKYFDGPKDMLAYYFSPGKYGGTNQGDIKDILVKDYYSLKMIDGRKAFYVIGSDVYGPMGNEFVPFSSKEAAKSFAKDHKAKMVLEFKQITASQVRAMRNGQMMMKMK
jgi:nitrous oxide reductase accessory protein NosL